MAILAIKSTPSLFAVLFLGSSSLSRAFTFVSGLALLPGGICAEQTVEIHGYVEVANYNPGTGEVHLNTKAHSTFVATLSGHAWSICVTNVERGVTRWTQRLCDGTNTYVLSPSGGSFWNTNAPKRNLQQATISPSTVALTFDADPLGASLVSIAYGLSPHSFATNQIGLVEMPLPWTVVRENPNAFGFKWVFSEPSDGRFLKDFCVFREEALDLPEQAELLRPQLDYPETLADYQGYMRELRWRKMSPQGYLRARYKCQEWYRTNHISIPRESKLEVFLPPSQGNLPGRILHLEATHVTIRAGLDRVLPEIDADTIVVDYRYKKANKTRIFKYAQYMLKPGESWRSATDPTLLAEAEDWLEHGQEYTHFTESAHLSNEEAEEREVLNKPAAQWETTDLEGERHSLTDYRGKVLVLDFWFRNCAPCIMAMPQIKEIVEQFRGKRVVVLGMNIDQEEKDARFVVNRLHLNYPTLKGEGLPEKYNVHSCPTLVIIDQQGIVRGWHVGYSADLREKVTKTINLLLTGP
jgi:thiol-disulfide isomerase/thioredoxin